MADPTDKPVTHPDSSTPVGILQKETDARFDAQTGFKPGQKIDPSNPADAALIPLWKATFAKVKAEDDAHRLVLTYNNPHVAQNLADAHVADKGTAASLEAAAATPDPVVKQQHLDAAQAGIEISAKKTQAAAKLQPPTIPPAAAHQAAQQVAAAPPPPPSAPAQDHIAHEQAKAVGVRVTQAHDRHRGRRPVRSTVPHGKIQQHYRSGATSYAHQANAQFVLVIEHPDGAPEIKTFATRVELDTAYAQIEALHDQYRYVAAFDLGFDPSGPIIDSVGLHAAEFIEQPDGDGGQRGHHRHRHHRHDDHQRGEGPTGGTATDTGPGAGSGSADAGSAAGSGSGSADAGATGGSGSADGSSQTFADPAPAPGWSTGQKIAAVIGTIAAIGTLTYMATHKRKGSAPRRAATKVLVATPGLPLLKAQ